MNKAVVVVAVLLAGGLGYYLWSQNRQAPAPAPAPAPPPPPPPPAVVDGRPAEPQIKYPVETRAPARPAHPLPSLDDSDPVMRERMTELFGAKQLGRFFITEELIRRVVATVDNLPRERVAPDTWPIRPVPGSFLVERDASGLTISPKNTDRYTAHVALAESVPPRKLVALYVRHYPLFQKAYLELGYPQGYFNDRLVEVIDHLLAAPDAPAPVRLSQPNVRYEFANDEQQSRSVGQKTLMRMGPQHAARVKAVLREIRSAITARMR
jgi:hypothetical protein